MTKHSAGRRNPYIIGRPIDEPKWLFGRESLFSSIESNLNQGEKVILLHGQRRIGKSSLLRSIPNFVELDKFAFVPFDLENRSQENLSSILADLITEILEYLEFDSDQIKITEPSATELETDPYIFSSQFLPQVYQALNGRNLVLLLDEFDALNNNNSGSVLEHFFPYLRSIIEQQDKLFIILCVGRHPKDLPNLRQLFKDAPFQEIGLLDEPSAKRLITKPAARVLEYEPEAIQEIVKLSAGHPYFIQVICFTLFVQARTENNWKVTLADVNTIVGKAIESAQAGLAWFWDGLSIPERVVFSAVAEAQNIALSKGEGVPEDPLTLLKNYGVIQTDSLIQAAKQLTEDGFLDDTGRIVKIELVRRWLVQRHSLRQEIRELEKLGQQEVNPLQEEADVLGQQRKKQNAVARYEQILEINPNHFSTVVVLADEYLEAQDFDKAIELYTRAYQVDPRRNKEGLLQALETYGHKLITQKELQRAKEQYNRILEIEPENTLAQEKLREIEAIERGGLSENQGLKIESKNKPSAQIKPQSLAAIERGDLAQIGNRKKYNSQYKRKGILLGGITVVAGIITITGVGVRWLTSCPTCVADLSINISRGERTLFPSIGNSARDLGMEAFKQREYSQAAEFLKKTVADNPNDPEVLIYYNNARARQKGSPITLAVVVPVDNQAATAQEILRGVAQAQNQFNNKQQKLKSRLLEIAIANEADSPQKAKQVAQQLIKDRSVLGVIGHYSSAATKVALAEYEKAGLAIISPTSTNTSLTSHVFFRTVPSDAATGKKLAEYARKLRLNTVVIFSNPGDPYSDSLSKEFTQNFQQLGGEVVGKPINLTEKLNVETEVKNSLLAYQAQAALLFPNIQHTDVALQVAKANATFMAHPRNREKLGLKLLGGDTLYSNTTLKEDNAVEGLIVAVPWFREAPQAQGFSNAAAQQWKGPVSWVTATSYDATQAFIKALSPSPSRSTVLQRLPQVKLSSSETSGKALQFTLDGKGESKPILVKVVKGKFELVEEQK